MTLDKRFRKLLTLLYDLNEEDAAVQDFVVEYVEEAGGRRFVMFEGSYVSQSGRVGFFERFAVDVVCSLYEDGYLETKPGARAADPGFESIPALRDVSSQLANPGKHKIPILQISNRGCELVERKFEED